MEKYVKINDVIDQLANEFGCVDAVTRGMLYALTDADVEPVRPELRKAVGLLNVNYEKGLGNPVIRDPLAWALFQTWKEAMNGRC